MVKNIRQVQSARDHYGIDSWGSGYFSINKNGQVCAHPTGEDQHEISIQQVAEQVAESDLSTPFIIRFPQIIEEQLGRLHKAFSDAIWNYSYKGQHLGVFPFKVNQRREFIDSICAAGAKNHYGLEVGSKTEFMAALSYKLPDKAMFICNGFKDREYIELCFISKAMNKNVIIVIEGPNELELILDYAKTNPEFAEFMPEIGIRAKLYTRSSGKWSKSSGEGSKFGLSTNELICCLDMLKSAKMTDQLTMLHFHNGSQITEIKKMKNAVKEAARVFSKVSKLGFGLKYLNVGGGIGVDYDGSKTSSQSSVNYTMQQFANDCVYTIGEVCKNEKISPPNIVTESGRVIAAHHSVVITDIREVQSPINPAYKPTENSELLKVSDQESLKTLQELEYTYKNINQKNYNEFYHDAVEYQEELFTLFNLGFTELADKARGEALYQGICYRAVEFSMQERHPSDVFIQLQKSMVTQYLANFSMFQSIPDAWSIDQLFPVLPLSRHHEKPTQRSTIVDITCDSDGCLDRFIGRDEIRRTIDLHIPDGNAYFLGFFLVGAYQESLANEHNLFGAIHEVEVCVQEDGSWRITKMTEGDPIRELLACRNFNIEELKSSYRVQTNIKSLSKKQREFALSKLESMLSSFPYLTEQTEYPNFSK